MAQRRRLATLRSFALSAENNSGQSSRCSSLGTLKQQRAKSTPYGDSLILLENNHVRVMLRFVRVCFRALPGIPEISRQLHVTCAQHEATSFAKHATTMIFPHFVGDARSREPHRPPIFLTSRTPIPRYVCVGPDRSAGLDNTGSPGDLRSPGLFNCLNCETPLSRLSRSFA
jgi:hypothetical protein